MTQHFKGKYKLSCPIDKSTNDFPKTLKGTNEESDIFIPCARDGTISYYGHGVLEYYVPSLQVGNNKIKEIYSKYINPNNVTISETNTAKGIRTTYNIVDNELFDSDLNNNKNIIFNIVKTDEEVLFKFRFKDEDKIIPILKPRTGGAKTSVFSVKNLPKSDYIIPDEDLDTYRTIIENHTEITKLDIAYMTNAFINSMANRKNTIDKIKSDMRKRMLRGKEYIHSIGKWDDYIKFINKEIQKKEMV